MKSISKNNRPFDFIKEPISKSRKQDNVSNKKISNSSNNKTSNKKKWASLNKSSKSQSFVYKQIKQIMTSTAYNAIFNKLVSIECLQKFVRQSSRYAYFYQPEVLPLMIDSKKQKFRFSFSLRNTSVCQFLIKDYRFLAHYYKLLVIRFPDKKDQIKQSIYNNYRQNIVDVKKFDEYFAQKNNFKIDILLQTQSQQIACKKIYSSISAQKTKYHITINQKSIKSNKSKSNKSLRKDFTISRKKLQKSNQKIGISKVKQLKQHIQKQSQKQHSQSTSKSNYKKTKKQDNQAQKKQRKNQRQRFKQNNTMRRKLDKQQKIHSDFQSNNQADIQSKQARRSRKTMQNILIIQNTINEIEKMWGINNLPLNEHMHQTSVQNHICQVFQGSKDNQQVQLNKYIYEQETDIQEVKNQKVISKTEFTTQKLCTPKLVNQQYQPIQGIKLNLNQPSKSQQNAGSHEEQYFQKLFSAKRNQSNKKFKQTEEHKQAKQQAHRRVKQTRRKTNKIITFKQFIDQNNPKDIALMDKVRNLSKKLQLQQKQQNSQTINLQNKIGMIQKTIQEFQKSVIRPFDESQKKLLPSQLLKVLQLFKQIQNIGRYKQFEIDNQGFAYQNLGQIQGYNFEQVLTWPKNIQLNPCKGLVVTKLPEKDQLQDSKDKLVEMKKKIEQKSIKGIKIVLMKN